VLSDHVLPVETNRTAPGPNDDVYRDPGLLTCDVPVVSFNDVPLPAGNFDSMNWINLLPSPQLSCILLDDTSID
jgi:hypothetical protein